MDSRNTAARRRRATPRKSARATAAPSNRSTRTQTPTGSSHSAARGEARGEARGGARVTPKLAVLGRARGATPAASAVPTPSARTSLLRSAWASLPTMLSFAPTPPPGSLGASTPRGAKRTGGGAAGDSDDAHRTPRVNGAPNRRGSPITKTSEPLLPGPAAPSAPLTDGFWDDDEQALSGELSAWPIVALPERETDDEETSDPWQSLSERTSAAWLVAPSWSDHLHDWLATVAPYSWRERAWRRGFWRRRILRALTLVAVVAVVTLIAYGAFNGALRATHTSLAQFAPISSATPGPGGFVVSAPTGDQNATPTSPAYVIGTWVSNDVPSGGQITLFAKVTHNTGPVKGAKVVFTVQYPNGDANYGPVKTDAAGLAQVKIAYGAGRGQVVFVIATTHANGQDITADTSFTPF